MKAIANKEYILSDMKIAYLGKIQLSDTDLPYLHEAQKMADITYILEINPRFMQGPAFNIRQLYTKSGLFKAKDIYPEFNKLDGFIDLDKCYVLNTCGKLWILKSFWTHILLLVFLLHKQFEVIHLAWPPNIYEFILYVLRKKMILTVHDPIPHSGLNTFIVKLRRKFSFRLIPRFILLNKAQRKEFLSVYNLREDQVLDSHLSSCTYLHTVTPASNNIPPHNSFVLFLGKISPYKGLDYLLPAIIIVHKQCPDCKLIVAGNGKFHFDISTYSSFDFIDLRNRFIPENELVALIKNCAFMVCPYTDATQSGVIMSAFAFNKPVIATNVGGLPEMVKNQHYGIIINEKDTDALAESIITLWTNPKKKDSFAENIESDYGKGDLSWKKIARDVSALYFKSIQ